MLGFCEVNDVLHPTAMNRAMHPDTTTTLDQQSPSLPSVTDSDRAISGRSLRETNAENTGDHYPSRNQYDIV